jgi:hypothetical protein
MLATIACIVCLVLMVATLGLAFKMGKNPQQFSPETTRMLVIGGIASGVALGLANAATHFYPNWTSKVRRR